MTDHLERTTLELPPTAAAAGMARAFLRQALCAADSASVVDDAVLLTSEAVTNAVLHGGPPIVLAVECNGGELQVRVRDASSTVPRPREAPATAEGGRGMELIDLLSDDWGVDEHVGDGKDVWFVLRPT